MPRSKKNKRAASATEGKPDQESVMEDQGDDVNSMEEEVHKLEGDYVTFFVSLS